MGMFPSKGDGIKFIENCNLNGKAAGNYTINLTISDWRFLIFTSVPPSNASTYSTNTNIVDVSTIKGKAQVYIGTLGSNQVFDFRGTKPIVYTNGSSTMNCNIYGIK